MIEKNQLKVIHFREKINKRVAEIRDIRIIVLRYKKIYVLDKKNGMSDRHSWMFAKVYSSYMFTTTIMLCFTIFYWIFYMSLFFFHFIVLLYFIAKNIFPEKWTKIQISCKIMF